MVVGAGFLVVDGAAVLVEVTKVVMDEGWTSWPDWWTSSSTQDG